MTESLTRLIQKYEDILDLAELQALSRESPGLAGLFVADAQEAYLASTHPIMIVGQETGGWLTKDGGLAGSCAADSLGDYLETCLQRHRRQFEIPASTSRFFQFYWEVNRRLGGGNQPTVAWSNLFCLAHHEGSPVGSPRFERILEISGQLLQAQIEVLRPRVILFVTGPGYDKYLKRNFKIEQSKRIIARRLWAFTTGGVLCLRTTHPRYAQGLLSRHQALALMEQFLQADTAPGAFVEGLETEVRATVDAHS